MAKKVTVGATLLQEGDDGQLHPLSYFSSTLDDMQKNYSPTELECWAAIGACRKFDAYIKGAPKLIRISDHNPLCWLRKQKDPRGKFRRWILELESYNYVFQHCPGSAHAGPDCLSRLEQGSPDPVVNDEGYFDRKVYCIDQSL